MFREIQVHPRAPIPQGYAFLPKGIAYKTLHCRKSTREADMPLFVVVDNKKILGLRAPRNIISQIHEKANATWIARRAAVAKRDASYATRIIAEIRRQFPKMPAAERERVLKHGFKKFSGRVGRTGKIGDHDKVLLAVSAHARHMHTNYDHLLRVGTSRAKARKTILRHVDRVMQGWGSRTGIDSVV
ncbi:hypothetical protein ACEQ8H_005464 [Pleosporales sp. CAS-2024a]